MTRFGALRLCEHPLAQEELARLRAATTDPPAFRRALEILSILLVAEATRDIATTAAEVETPLGRSPARRLAQSIVAVPLLRAGLGMLGAVATLYPDAKIGHIGLYRDERTLRPVVYFQRLPPPEERQLWLVLDPMLATGGSAAAALAALRAHGVSDMRLVCVVAAPEGMTRIEREHPDLLVYAAALDSHLNARGFIVPGLGDAGDRLFGTSG